MSVLLTANYVLLSLMVTEWYLANSLDPDQAYQKHGVWYPILDPNLFYRRNMYLYIHMINRHWIQEADLAFSCVCGVFFDRQEIWSKQSCINTLGDKQPLITAQLCGLSFGLHNKSIKKNFHPSFCPDRSTDLRQGNR